MVDINLLVNKAKSGDKEALIQLILADKDNYYRLAYSFLRNEHDSMDVVSEMTLIVFEKIKELKDNKKFYSWSKTILVNLCKKEYKRKNKVISIEDVSEISLEYVEPIEDKLDLDIYIDKLSLKHQQIIKLRYFLDMEYSTISEVLKIPVGTVKSRLSKGMESLRRLVEGEK